VAKVKYLIEMNRINYIGNNAIFVS